MSSYRFTPADRGPDGLIAIEPPAAPDLTPATPPAVSTARRPALVDSQHWIVIAGVMLALVLIGLARYATPSSSPAIPTLPATSAPTLAPTATPFGAALNAALVAYFDYARPETATALDHGTRVQPIARIAHAWLQVQLVNGTAVWVRWRDLPSPSAALDALPDLTPPTPVPTEVPTTAPVPVFAPPPLPLPTADTRPEACVRTDAGQLCRRGLDAHDATVAAEIAATSAAYNAPFQAAYDATATAVMQR